MQYSIPCIKNILREFDGGQHAGVVNVLSLGRDAVQQSVSCFLRINGGTGQLGSGHGGNRKKTIVNTNPIDGRHWWRYELGARCSRKTTQRAVGKPRLVNLLQVFAVVPLRTPDRILALGLKRHRSAQHQRPRGKGNRFVLGVLQFNRSVEKIVCPRSELFRDPDSRLVGGNHGHLVAVSNQIECRVIEAFHREDRQIHTVV